MHQNNNCGCHCDCNCGCAGSAENATLALAQAGFVISDLILYLDTHPTDQRALAYFAKKKEQYEAVKAAYCEQVGPVTPLCVNPADGWTWGDAPWPWEV